ncbi:MAG TPA: FAD synthetase family protein [Metabacillus sp.]|nr:FAD synthetase family protein [Metabacillus sp.]
MEIVNLEYPMNSIVQDVNKPCVMALGFFDGLHKGHRKIMEIAKAIAKKEKLTFTVMTFFPHPSNVIPSSRKIDHYITPLPIKKQLFKEVGVERLIIVNFNTNFSKLSHQQFVEEYLVGLNCKHVLAGFDFTYGFKGQGNMEQIVSDSKGRFEVTTVGKVVSREEKISSTMVRELLQNGDVHKIPSVLGDCYSISAYITQVEKSFAHNLEVEFDADYLLPSSGLYRVKILVGNHIVFGMVKVHDENIGTLVIKVEHIPIKVEQRAVKILFISRLGIDSFRNKRII